MMLHKDTPTLCWTLPMFDWMQKHLEQLIDSNISYVLHQVLTCGLNKLNEYYDIAKDSQHAIMATGSSPESFPDCC